MPFPHLTLTISSKEYQHAELAEPLRVYVLPVEDE